jgi:alkylation response protein AidB-like acyl-CoA dehydrogenase
MLMKANPIRITEPLVAATALVNSLRERGAAISEQRCLPRESLDELSDAGLMSLLRPKHFDGQKHSLKTAMQVSRELARGDGSVGWVHGVYTAHDHMVGLFPTVVQEEYWSSSQLPLCASSIVPTGKVLTVSGGYELTGSWSFCSGVDHVNWIILSAITGMISNEPPVPDRRLFMVPISDVDIVDDWWVMGLRGTGSKSVVLDRVFVPSIRVICENDIADCCTPGAATHAGNEFKYPAWPLLSFGLVGLAAKMAQNAYEQTITEFQKSKNKPNPLFDIRRAAATMHLAEASAKIDAAELLYTRALDETFAIVEGGTELTMELRVRNRRDQCFAAKIAHDAATVLMSIGGARGLREAGAVQRAQRDLTALTLHPASNWDATALSFGTVALGGSPTELIV